MIMLLPIGYKGALIPLFIPNGGAAMTGPMFASTYGAYVVGTVTGIGFYEIFVKRTAAGRKLERELFSIPQIWKDAGEEVKNEPKPLTIKEIWKSSGEEVRNREKVYQPSMLSIWEDAGYEIERASEQ